MVIYTENKERQFKRKNQYVNYNYGGSNSSLLMVSLDIRYIDITTLNHECTSLL